MSLGRPFTFIMKYSRMSCSPMASNVQIFELQTFEVFKSILAVAANRCMVAVPLHNTPTM